MFVAVRIQREDDTRDDGRIGAARERTNQQERCYPGQHER